MRKSNPNKVKIIFGENDFPYFQDHHFKRGIPSGIEFQIDSWEKASVRFISQKCADELEIIRYKLEVNEGTIWLSAPGYGLDPYGNGRIAIRPSLIFEKAPPYLRFLRFAISQKSSRIKLSDFTEVIILNPLDESLVAPGRNPLAAWRNCRGRGKPQ